jgi:Ca-dependent carbohydrate-binding module xylan-binding
VNTGTIIRDNHIIDPNGLKHAGGGKLVADPGAHGIYLDDLVAGVTVTGNIIEGGSRAAVFVHGGDNNTIGNNVAILDSSGWGNFYRNESKSMHFTSLDFPSSSAQITVSAWGKVQDGVGSKFKVYVDDKLVGETTATLQTKDYLFTATGLAPNAPHKVTLQFTNDASARDLYVQSLEVNGNKILAGTSGAFIGFQPSSNGGTSHQPNNTKVHDNVVYADMPAGNAATLIMKATAPTSAFTNNEFWNVSKAAVPETGSKYFISAISDPVAASKAFADGRIAEALLVGISPDGQNWGMP